MTDLTKEKRISAEEKRISCFFEDIAENQLAIIKPLIQNAAFMKVTLEDLQDIINSEGVIETYQNGVNQSGVKQSASLQSYNSLIKNYSAVIKSLSQLLPPESKKTMASSFTSWGPRIKTEEEIEEERHQEEEHQRKLKEELDRAVEYQRRQREKEQISKGI